jgi:hypothetical protein
VGDQWGQGRVAREWCLVGDFHRLEIRPLGDRLESRRFDHERQRRQSTRSRRESTGLKHGWKSRVEISADRQEEKPDPLCSQTGVQSSIITRPLAMTEIHFIVAEAPEGGFTARAVGADILTEADDLPGLYTQVRDAVRCHFDDDKRPSVIRLHITREESLAA